MAGCRNVHPSAPKSDTDLGKNSQNGVPNLSQNGDPPQAWDTPNNQPPCPHIIPFWGDTYPGDTSWHRVCWRDGGHRIWA